MTTSRLLPADDTPEIALRLESWRPSYSPETPEQDWLFNQVVVNSVRLDRCLHHEAALRANQQRRAMVSWDDDRRLDAEILGASLSRKPAVTLRKLRRTKQGCEWLLERWLALAAIFESKGEWTEPQHALALDLLGTPPEFRDLPNHPPAELAAREITRLELQIAASLEPLDALDRQAAQQGLDIHPDPALNQLRRLEAATLKRMQWASNRLKSLRKTSPLPDDPIPLPYHDFPPSRLAASPLNEPLAPAPRTPTAPTLAPPRPNHQMNRRQRRAASRHA